MNVKPIFWKCTNKNGDEVTIILHYDGHTRLIIDFVKHMEIDEVWKFIDKAGYKLNSTSFPKLKLIKK